MARAAARPGAGKSPRSKLGTAGLSFARSLVLFRFMLGRLGYASFEDLKGDFATPGVSAEYELADSDIDGSRILALLENRGNHAFPNLREYDACIRDDLARINRHRQPNIRLKYFQYFSLLFTEYYLERYFADADGFAQELSDFAHEMNPDDESGFAREELGLLAFWNATGSGKTLLFHMNLLQLRRHAGGLLGRKPPLLITPSAEMTAQHLSELALSGIRGSHYSDRRQEVDIQVIEIHKIRRPQDNVRKASLDKSYWLDEFEEKNVLFVDEGHKGSGSRATETKEESAWREIRRAMAAGGFTFEYSATFGHIGDPDIRSLYAKAIIFDYSYRHFHGDGYGKDFHITNLEEGSDLEQEETRHRYLFENLLVFLQQKLFFQLRQSAIAEHLPEDPLQIFVGHTVNPKSNTKEDQATIGDVEKVLAFHRDVLSNKTRYLKMLEQILHGREPRDVALRGQIAFLIANLEGTEDILRKLLKLVFHADGPGALQICRLPGTTGEIGLRCGNSEFYYGVINIGDAGGFLANLDESYNVTTPDRFAPSLFRSLQTRTARPVNVLIGARKFIEGWNNYRVSSIGLINFGRREGTLVMQLFGRGVRLRGKDFSLKRCAAGEGPDDIRIAETLNVFGLNAAYMETFQQMLAREGVAHEAVTVPLVIPAEMRQNIQKHNLHTIRRIRGAPPFHEQQTEALKSPAGPSERASPLPGSAQSIVPRLDLRSRQKVISGDTVVQTAGGTGFAVENRGFIQAHSVLGIDWDLLESSLVSFTHLKHFANLRFDRAILQRILHEVPFEVTSDRPLSEIIAAHPNRSDQIRRLVQKILCQYVERYYARLKSRFEGRQLEAALLVPSADKSSETAPIRDYLGPPQPGADGSVQMRIQVRNADGEVDQEGVQLREEISKLVAPALKGNWPAFLKSLQREETPWTTRRPRWNIWAEFHAYQPLLVEPRKDKLGRSNEPGLFDTIASMSPPGLVPSETTFVEHLRTYWANNQAAHTGDSLFLLRNAGRGKGIGFYTELFGFYPDFLLWLVRGKTMYLTFVEPHGLRFEEGGFQSSKVRLAQELAGLRIQGKPKGLILNSFILSKTPLALIDADVDPEAAAAMHVLAMDENGTYVGRLFELILASG